jgi:general secretion pathway protein D
MHTTTHQSRPRSALAPLWRGLSALALAVVLAGCAATAAYKEGNTLFATGKTEQGLAKLEEAVKLDPANAQYRITLATRRATAINALILQAENARRNGRLSDAEKAYRQVQGLDPGNAMALQGIDALAVERRHRMAVAEAETLFKKGTPFDLTSALDRLRPVLAENPKQRDALNLKARIDDARAKEMRTDAKLAARFNAPISLEFRDTPLRAVLELISKVSGLNFYYDKDIRPDLKVTVFARQTTIADALRLLLVTNQLEQKVLNDSSILVYPNTPQKAKEYQTLAVRSFYLTNGDVKAVANTIKTIVKTKDIVVDERLGIIIVRDTPDAVRMAERIVALQDLSDPEVMLEVEVLEVKRSRLSELGVQWPSQMTLAPLQANGAALTLETLRKLTAATTQVTIGGVTVNANQNDQDTNILANPRIRVRNKDKAKVQIGDRVPVITATSTSTGFVSESVSYVDVGLKLEVEPTIYLDDEVAIKVNLEVSNLVREIQSKSGTLSYQIGTRGANTVLRLADGETQVLAGLISEDDSAAASKVPLLGELPIAGRLFGSKKDTRDRSEILLSITPHVVRAIRRPDMLAAEFDSGTEASIGAQPLRLSTVEAPAAESGKDGAAKPAAAPGTPADPNQARTIVPVTTGAPAPGAVTGAPAPAAAVPAGASFVWQAPADVKVGEQFSAVLRLNSQQALRGMPVLLGFDPQVLQVVNVREGEFFKQGNGRTSFSQRVDAAAGRVLATSVRQSGNGLDPGVNGSAGLVTVTFKAIKAAPASKVQLLSATPEPSLAVPVPLPVEYAVRVQP